MISFLTWLWQPAPSADRVRYSFNAESVNVLFRMISRHYDRPHRKICVTNIPNGIDSSVEIVKDREDYATIQNPSGSHNPSCYRRLRAFAPDAAQVFGDRFISFDLDTVVCGDLKPLVDRPEDFVIWGQSDYPHAQWYNGSLWMLRAGTRQKVWTEFDKDAPQKAKNANARGSDQGWISYILGPKEATWSTKDGVYSYRVHIASNGNQLPKGARVVCFHGRRNPWSGDVQRVSWVREHYH